MISLSGHVCLNHAGREAVAKCPGCGQFFCRECITEHDDRVLCSGCLRKLVRIDAPKGRWGTFLARSLQMMAGFFVAWVMFYATARVLLSLPANFHDGTLWKTSLFED
jgi:hypothetical protein